MRYFIVTNEQTAKDLSSLIYKIMYPTNDSGGTQYLFGWGEYLGQTVIKIKENLTCPVFQKSDFQPTIDAIGAILGDAPFQVGEGNAFIEYLKTGSIILENIIPSGLTEVSEADYLASLPTPSPY